MRFETGMKLQAVYGPAPIEFLAVVGDKNDRHPYCTDIEVVMQDGQMANVAWAICRYRNGDTVLVNLAQMESVKVCE